MMPDAFIYDHVRTPRGRGKADGALHEVTALGLATRRSSALSERNELDPALVDDVVIGCVDPVGEAGGDIARAAALVAGYRRQRPRRADQPLLRLRPRRGEFRRRADHVGPAATWPIGGGVESMSRVGIGAVRRRLGGRSVDRGGALLSCRRASPPT